MRVNGLADQWIRSLDLNLKYRPGSADEEVIGHSFENDIFLPALPEYKPGRDHTVLDVGAHIGAFSCLLARKISGGRIFAIEACRETFEILSQNVEANGLDNVHPIHLALFNHQGTAILYHDLQTGNWGHSMTKALSSSMETVACDTLENFFDVYNIQHCNLVKMNCEGSEFRILLGASTELLRRIETMLVLYHCYLEPEHQLDELQRHLHDAGFYTRTANATDSEGWLIAFRRPPSRKRKLGHAFGASLHDKRLVLRRRVGSLLRLVKRAIGKA